MGKCSKCGGTGFVVYEDDPSPSGVSLSPGTMMFSDPCPECYEKDICPRCGRQLPEESAIDDENEEYDVCYGCGWDSKSGEADAYNRSEA